MKACVIIPSYNTGFILQKSVTAALSNHSDIIVIIDGSDDGSDEHLEKLKSPETNLHIIRLAENSGKGAAILEGLKFAQQNEFTHALTMDADGQHPAEYIPKFIKASTSYPEALVLGKPIFDQSVPKIRLEGRKVSNGCANLATFWWGINDSLFGMRVYPIEPLLKIFSSTRGARRFDFDPECAIKLCWRKTPVINLPTPVRYLSKEDGGISQFKYLRDNTLLTSMYLRLALGFFWRIPLLAYRTIKGGNPLKNIDLS